MTTKQQTRGSRDGFFGCLLLVALLISSLAALIFGSFATSGRKNPIENLMLAIRDGFVTQANDPEDEEEDDWGDNWDDEGEDEWGDDWDDETTALLTTNVGETTNDVVMTTCPEVSHPSPDSTTDDITPPVTDDVTETEPAATTDAASTTIPETDSDTMVPAFPVTTCPSETTVSETSPPESTIPETVPPETLPPETKPPVTEPPIVDPDRVNDPNYYHDALFIGDSRIVGLATYGKINGATYFARTSMNVANVFADKKSETEKSGLNLTDFLTKYKFKKIYILLGINEIGYSYSWIMTRYEKVVNKIRELQPDAIIVIQSNMHVTQKKSDASPNTFNNDRINGLNKRLASLADNKTVFYADMAYIFDNENGAMKPEYTGDGVHLKGKYYALWRDWLLEKGKR